MKCPHTHTYKMPTENPEKTSEIKLEESIQKKTIMGLGEENNK